MDLLDRRFDDVYNDIYIPTESGDMELHPQLDRYDLDGLRSKIARECVASLFPEKRNHHIRHSRWMPREHPVPVPKEGKGMRGLLERKALASL